MTNGRELFSLVLFYQIVPDSQENCCFAPRMSSEQNKLEDVFGRCHYESFHEAEAGEIPEYEKVYKYESHEVAYVVFHEFFIFEKMFFRYEKAEYRGSVQRLERKQVKEKKYDAHHNESAHEFR